MDLFKNKCQIGIKSVKCKKRGETDFKPYNDYIKKYSQNNNLKIHNEKQKNKKKHPFTNTLTKYQLVTDHMRYFIEGNKPKHS